MKAGILVSLAIGAFLSLAIVVFANENSQPKSDLELGLEFGAAAYKSSYKKCTDASLLGDHVGCTCTKMKAILEEIDRQNSRAFITGFRNSIAAACN